MRRDRRVVLVLLLAGALLVVSGRALMVDQHAAPHPAGGTGRDSAADASIRSNDIVLAAEQAKQALVRAVFDESLGAPVVDLAALSGTAFLVAIALVPVPARRRALPTVLLRGPPLAALR